MGAVEVGVGFEESAVLGLEIFQLFLEVLDVFLLALAEGSLRGPVLGTAPLENVRVGSWLREGRGENTYDAHVGNGFFVLGGGRSPSSSVLVLGSGEIHEFDRVDNGGLVIKIMRGVCGVGV